MYWLWGWHLINWITNLHRTPKISSRRPVAALVWRESDAEVMRCERVRSAGRRAASRKSPAVWVLAQRQCKHVAVGEATSTVMYLLSNLRLSERPYIPFREWHLSSSTLWSGAGIWWGLEHAVLMDELVKVAPWCPASHRTHRAGATQ